MNPSRLRIYWTNLLKTSMVAVCFSYFGNMVYASAGAADASTGGNTDITRQPSNADKYVNVELPAAPENDALGNMVNTPRTDNYILPSRMFEQQLAVELEGFTLPKRVKVITETEEKTARPHRGVRHLIDSSDTAPRLVWLEQRSGAVTRVAPNGGVSLGQIAPTVPTVNSTNRKLEKALISILVLAVMGILFIAFEIV